MLLLKLVSAIFHQIFYFSPNDSPSKTVNVFFMEKAFFVLKTRTNGSGIVYDVMNWLA